MSSTIADKPGRSRPAASADDRPRAAERILNSARDLFYRQGIRAVGVDEIVANAGVTKPSLYRSFSSKDELAAAYVRRYEVEFWARFNGAIGEDAADPKAQLLDYLDNLALRSITPDYRGCGISNTAIEYPEPDHPARLAGESHKAKLRARLQQIAVRMGARDPELLGDGLMLLIEGAFASGQIFHGPGPSGNVARAARVLIAAATA
ncbi:MAG TPA: TetR/AcrR family transcriptional regulator [Devosiaceae bacterium]|nr:TetR/AcrR family transcriptional regulator [Devosiaceae bacterium]